MKVLASAAAFVAVAAGGVAACSIDRDVQADSWNGRVHAPGMADPRSSDFHAIALRADGWRPMLEANHSDACGRCHEGVPVRPPGVTHSAPGAPACTSCHSEPSGVLACDTCHGKRESAFSPNSSSFAGAHAVHTGGTALLAPLSCGTCHPSPVVGSTTTISGTHGNRSVEVLFDPNRVTPASWDNADHSCAVGCHDHGGARSRPVWTDTAPMTCGDCHGAPPANHAPGACTTCHREANRDGTALSPGPMHLDGKVSLGDGSGKCGACHGSGDDPWPSTGAHAAHKSPSTTAPIACADCHKVPAGLHDAGHMNGRVDVVLSGRARDRFANPSWDGASCKNVACHGAGLPETPSVVPTWLDASGAGKACTACHGAPPTILHTTSSACGTSGCHSGAVSGTSEWSITSTGKATHINGSIDVGK